MHWPASGSTTYVTRKTKKACSFPSWKYLIWLHVIQTQSSLKVTLDSASVCFFLYLQTTFLSKPSKLSIFLHSEKPLSIAYGEKQTSKHTHTNALCTCNEGNTRKKKKKKEEEDRRGETHTLPLQQNTAIMEAAAVRRKGGVYATLSSQEIIYVHTHKHTHMHSRSKHPDRCWGFFFVKWDTSSIVAAIKATTPRAGTQKEF